MQRKYYLTFKLKTFLFCFFSKLHHGICYCINTEASASIRISARNASLYIAVMIFCAQPYLKPCFMCPFYILSTCPSKGLCTALGDSITQSGGHGCRDRPEKHQQELRLNSCERNRERDVTKLDCSHYNQHSCLMWNQMNDLVLSHGTACVTIATSCRRHIIFSSLLKRSSATNRQKIIHLKWYIYINNSRLHYACATKALAVVYFQHATAMIVIIIILCI